MASLSTGLRDALAGCLGVDWRVSVPDRCAGYSAWRCGWVSRQGMAGAAAWMCPGSVASGRHEVPDELGESEEEDGAHQQDFDGQDRSAGLKHVVAAAEPYPGEDPEEGGAHPNQQS